MHNYQKTDSVLLFAIFTLLLFGLAMIASAGIFYSQTRFGDQYYFLKRQFFYGVLPGLLVFYVFQKIDYHKWKKFSIPFFLATLVCLILVFVPGIGIKLYGASRWINLGPISFQPAEMAKLAIIFYLAAWFENKGTRKIRDIFEGLIPFLAIVALVGFLIIKQPNLGTLGVIVLIALSMFFSSGAKLSHFLFLAAAGAIGLLALVKTASYRLSRFLVFLNPDLDPRGIGYQINQALLAIGLGGIWGIGLGHSRQKYNYLPEPVGDSIFAIVGEELGLIGAISVIILFLILAFRGLGIAQKAPDEFGKLLAVGITSWIVLQAFVNVAAISGLVPLTGVPLPFLSYGGTSIIFLLAGAGVLANISKQVRN